MIYLCSLILLHIVEYARLNIKDLISSLAAVVHDNKWIHF